MNDEWGGFTGAEGVIVLARCGWRKFLSERRCKRSLICYRDEWLFLLSPHFSPGQNAENPTSLFAARKRLLRRLINIILIISNAARSPKLLPKRHFRPLLTLQNNRFFFPIRKARSAVSCDPHVWRASLTRSLAVSTLTPDLSFEYRPRRSRLQKCGCFAV